MMVEMKGIRNDVFHLYELYLLAEATGGNELFGLPNKTIYAIAEPDYLAQAKVSIQEKGILDEAGHITEGGFFVIKALSEYALSPKFVQLNNLMIASSASEPDERIVLVEVEESYYQLKVMDKRLLLKDLFDSLPIIQREPLPEETEFTLKKMRNRERRQVIGEEVSENSFALTVFDTNQVENEEQTSWLYFLEAEKLYVVKVAEESYYQASQYWLMKQLFDSLDIAYGNEGEV